MRDLIEQLNHHQDLMPPQVSAAIEALLDPAEPDETKADFLRALHAKGETATEIAGFAAALLDRAVDPGIETVTLKGPVIDVCGTGGDRTNLFNVSTTAMFLLAAGGAVVVKHGNRAISSNSGGADVLEALGVAIELPPAALRQCIAETGIGFIFAPAYHPAFRVVAPVRKALAEEGHSTIFNLLGPLLNPARPPYQLAGVHSEGLLQTFTEVLGLLGRRRAWAVHGSGGSAKGVDEFSTLGLNQYCDVTEGVVTAHSFDPIPFGFHPAEIEELRGGDREANARILTGILEGRIHGPKRDVVIINAAAGFVVCGLARGMADGITWAREQLDSGRALERLKALQGYSTGRSERA